jgi:hypothetical protein
MNPIANCDLAPEELRLLRELSRAHPHMLHHVRHTVQLVARGFAFRHRNGAGITQLGFAKLVYETTRANWFTARA